MRVLDSVSAFLQQNGEAVWSIAPEATIYEALQVMAEQDGREQDF